MCFVILLELIMSTCCFQFPLYYFIYSVVHEICSSFISSFLVCSKRQLPHPLHESHFCSNCIALCYARKNGVLCIFYERTNKYFKLTMRQISEFAVSDHQVSKLAGALAKMGVSRGDRVLVYMPMIPEAIISMLAAVRLGAVHSVVFGGMICFDLFCNHWISKRIILIQNKEICERASVVLFNKYY